ncbi:MAG TPA: dienelactone hydrolase family protein [Burkholderiaceae bacterium]|jgi:phospholipase/carboxylesterase|nr:dienelactone hydrolase family protein [Burkholderiaceae bacterium]
MPAGLETLEVHPASEPSACVVILHGLGADASDFLPVARQLELGPVGPVRFVMPYAPIRPVTVNGGYRMPAWYDILGSEIDRQEDEPGLRASTASLQALLDREAARGVPARRTVLMGFSQGCAMTLLAGLRYPQRLAGLVGLSGYLPLAATTAVERHAANADVPIFMGHGRRDGVVPLGSAEKSRDALRALGHDVEWHDYPMEHSVNMDEIADLQAWLLKALAV